MVPLVRLVRGCQAGGGGKSLTLLCLTRVSYIDFRHMDW